MAGITPGNIVATLTIEGTVDGNSVSSEFVQTLNNISYFDRRNMKALSASETEILKFCQPGAVEAAGKFDPTKTAMVFIFNRDDTNFVRVRLIKAGAETVDLKVTKGSWVVVPVVNFDVSATGAAFGAFVVPDQILIQADTGDCDIEYMVIQNT